MRTPVDRIQGFWGGESRQPENTFSPDEGYINSGALQQTMGDT